MKTLTKFLATASLLGVLASSPAYADGNGSGAYTPTSEKPCSCVVDKNYQNNRPLVIDLSLIAVAALGGVFGYALAKRNSL